jgi:hypothetical protein
MSTVARLELERLEATHVQRLCAAQHELIGVLRSQLTEANNEADMFRSDCVKAEALHDRFSDRLADICKANALGVDNSPMQMLDRIANRLRSYVETEELVKLCLKANRLSASIIDASDARAICAEVDRLKAEELPF